MEEVIEFRNQEGQLLSGRIHLPNTPTKKAVILCHGFSSTKDFMYIHHIAHKLAEKGYAALRFDFDGHGDSDGLFQKFNVETGMHDLDVALAVMQERGYEEFALIGHSIGAAIMIQTAPKHAEVKCMVTIAAPVRIHREDNEEFIRSVYAKYGLDSGALLDELPFLRILEEAEKVEIPICIIHGTADEVVPCKDAELLQDIVQEEAQIHLIEGGDHKLIPHTNDIVQLAISWVEKYLGE